MADYRDLAIALGGGYGQDTGGIMPDTLATLRNGKTASASDLLGMLKDFGGATLSNLESLGRGGAAAFFGSPVDTANMMRTPTPMGSIPLPANFNLRPSPLPGGSQDILGMMPRGTATRPETAGMVELGGFMTPATAKLAGKAIKATESLPVGMSIKDMSYRGSHIAPNAKTYGATLDDLTQIMPENVYTSQGKNLYGVRDSVIDHQWWMAAKKARGNPDAEVEVFRAVPKGVKDINSGDWVSTSRKYAEDHGESALSGEYEIISKKVKAKTLSTAGDPQEYGYNSD